MKRRTFIFEPNMKFGFIALIALNFNTEITKTVNEANIEDREEYLKIKETITHVKINKRLSVIEKANKIPKYVATPFPPLNFNHIGNI